MSGPVVAVSGAHYTVEVEAVDLTKGPEPIRGVKLTTMAHGKVIILNLSRGQARALVAGLHDALAEAGG
jgi:hypothetical protein